MPIRPQTSRQTALAIPSLVAFGAAACEAVVEDPLTPSPVASRIDAASPPPASQVAVVDARGLGRVTVVFADDARWSACLATIDGNVTVTAAGQPGDATAGSVGDKNAFGTVAGFDDETYVDGSHANGWYAMWWPGNVEAASVSSIDRGRVTIGSANPRQ